MARLSADAAELAQQIVAMGNTNAATDAAAGGLMAKTAVQIAAMNVKINAVGLEDKALVERWYAELAELEVRATAVADGIVALAAERAGF